MQKTSIVKILHQYEYTLTILISPYSHNPFTYTSRLEQIAPTYLPTYLPRNTNKAENNVHDRNKRSSTATACHDL